MKTFSERVVEAALSIPKGRVTTYGRIAIAAGGAAISAQSVTSILGKAWEQGEKSIPFHRIVYSDGRIWVNARYRKERMKLYKHEGIKVGKDDKVENFRDKLFEFE